MSLKSNYEYIRDWANAKFLKKTDQIKVDLSEYVTKDEVAGFNSSPWTWNGVNGGIIPKNNSNNTADGLFALANGQDNVATGTSSHAEGEGTTASGHASHSEGFYTTADGGYSHAEGSHTETSNYYEHASGRYNNSSAITSFSHGIGSSDDNRKNAFEITENGDVFVYGLGDYTGNTSSGSPKSLQTVISGLSGDFVAKDDYKDDEEVIAAALNDLNSRIKTLDAVLNLFPIIDVSDTNISVSDQNVSLGSYAKASLSSNNYSALGGADKLYMIYLKTKDGIYPFSLSRDSNNTFKCYPSIESSNCYIITTYNPLNGQDIRIGLNPSVG